MKALKFIIAVLFFSAIFVACKKEDVKQLPPTAPQGNSSLTGKWVGKYGYDAETPNIFFSFNIKANGMMEELNANGEVSGTGTWVKNGNTFTATHHYLPPYNSIFISSATFDPAAQRLSGTWKYSDAVTSAGKWYMIKE
ncbi:MAG: hypothetical protein V4685_16655 [Bacteroidota bacterium]